MIYRLITILVVLLLGCTSCLLPDDPAKQRAERAERAQGDILIGAVAPWSTLDTMLWEGIAMALDKINGAGGVLGRKIKILKRDDKASVEKGVLIAQQLSENPDVVGIIGHYQSFVTVPASVVYQYYGIFMLSTVDMDPDLTRQGFSLVFRTVPDDADYGKKLSDFCREKGYNRVVFYLQQDEYGRDFSDAFATAARNAGITIVDSEEYDNATGTAEFRDVLRRWKTHYSFDAIHLCGQLPQAAGIIREARRLGLEMPIIGGIELDRMELPTLLGKEIKDVFVPTDFDLHSEKSEVRAFVEAFQKRYGNPPDILAAHGYDTVYALAYAIQRAKSTSPPKMADALRSADNLEGVTGPFRFSKDGARIMNHITIKAVQDGQFKYLATETKQ